MQAPLGTDPPVDFGLQLEDIVDAFANSCGDQRPSDMFANCHPSDLFANGGHQMSSIPPALAVPITTAMMSVVEPRRDAVPTTAPPGQSQARAVQAQIRAEFFGAGATYVKDSPMAIDNDKECWGGILMQYKGNCVPGFAAVSGHFKNKLCANCRTQGIFVPAARVCTLANTVSTFSNRSDLGVWNTCEDGQLYRVINHTARCLGPRLAVFKGQAALSLGPEIPKVHASMRYP